MKYLAALYSGLRTLMIAALAGGAAGAQAQSPGDREASAWNAAREAGTVDAYQRFLERYPASRYSGDAFRGIVEMTIEPAAGDPDGEPSVSSRGLAVDMY